MKALLCGRLENILAPTAALLWRAGYSVDMISTHRRLKNHQHIDQFIYASSDAELLESFCQQARRGYALIVPCDDYLMRQVLFSSLSEAEKLAILPVMSSEDFSHLGSKIGLSLLFKQKEIRTPAFSVARHADELQECAEQVGFPVCIKIDFSSGGAGVYDCSGVAALQNLPALIYPVLIQKKIRGPLYSCCTLFLNKKLIFFDVFERVICRPTERSHTVVAQFQRGARADIPLFQELQTVGNALGANGFVNLAWIESVDDAKPYFFEADMRPTAWVEYALYFQEDSAEKIKRYLKTGVGLTEAAFVGERAPDVILACAPRLSIMEIILNRYNGRRDYKNYYKNRYLLRKLFGVTLSVVRAASLKVVGILVVPMHYWRSQLHARKLEND